jgi:hypothetical protein
MIAGILTAVAATVIFSLYIQAAVMAEGIHTTLEMNREARAISQMLLYGVRNTATGDNTTQPWVRGLSFIDGPTLELQSGGGTIVEWRNAVSYAPASEGNNKNQLSVITQRLQLAHNGDGDTDTDFNDSNDMNRRSRHKQFKVTCTGVDTPHPDCTGSNTLTVGGMVTYATVDQSERTLGGQTMEVEFQLVDPAYAGRSGYTEDQYKDTFRLFISTL